MNENLIKYYVENNRLDCLISLFEAQRDNLIRAEILNRSYLAEIARLKTAQPPSTQPPHEIYNVEGAKDAPFGPRLVITKKPAPPKTTKPSPLDLI